MSGPGAGGEANLPKVHGAVAPPLKAESDPHQLKTNFNPSAAPKKVFDFPPLPQKPSFDTIFHKQDFVTSGRLPPRPNGEAVRMFTFQPKPTATTIVATGTALPKSTVDAAPPSFDTIFHKQGFVAAGRPPLRPNGEAIRMFTFQPKPTATAMTTVPTAAATPRPHDAAQPSFDTIFHKQGFAPTARPPLRPSGEAIGKLTSQPKAPTTTVLATADAAPPPTPKRPTGKPVPPETQKFIGQFVDSVMRIGVEGFRKEFLEVKRNSPQDITINAFAANPQLNRYKDVVCNDKTRTVLTLNVPPETDYIHANWVKMENSDRTFIAAQAPLENTISDFWRLCFQENVATIVTLCNVVECGKRKSTQYWPLQLAQHVKYGCMSVHTKQVTEEDRVLAYTLEVCLEGNPNPLTVRLMHLSEWPDRGVPRYGFCVLRIIRRIVKGAPCLVHCSAGIGRTGTLIAIDTVVKRLFKRIPTEVKSVVQELRTKRHSSVQTEAQYVFIVSSVLDYIEAKMPTKFDEQLETFRNDVKKAAM